MSVKEVNQLRKDGRLDDAYRMADSDLKLEQSEWTYSAMFWVIRDYCNLYIGQRNYEFVSVCINKMHDILANMQDYEGVAKKALKTIEKKSDPHYDEIANLAEMSKNGEEEIAYNRICALHEVSPLANLFHEDYGWIIFRYLKKCYESCGSLNARKALFRYINLENSRPSILHSQIPLNPQPTTHRKWQVSKS